MELTAEIAKELVVLLISLGVLAKAADVVITNAVKLSVFFRISMVAVGFLLISTATSLPELAVSVTASAAHEGGIAVGNALGSNIANIGLVLGISAYFYTIYVKRKEIFELINILFVTSLIPLLLVLRGGLGFFEGVLLLITYAAFVYYMSRKKVMGEDHAEKVNKRQALTAFFLFCAAVFLVIVSSTFVVGSAVKIADFFGLAKSFVGATIIAVGTSLPELATDIAAIRRKQYSLALGDAIGSCMTNLTLVLGTTAILSPVIVNMAIFTTLIVFLLVFNLALWYFLQRGNKLVRKEGIALMALYVLFLVVASGVQIGYLGLAPK